MVRLSQAQRPETFSQHLKSPATVSGVRISSLLLHLPTQFLKMAKRFCFCLLRLGCCSFFAGKLPASVSDDEPTSDCCLAETACKTTFREPSAFRLTFCSDFSLPKY